MPVRISRSVSVGGDYKKENERDVLKRMGSSSPSERASAPSQCWHLSNLDQSRSFEQPGETPTSHGGENYERMHSTSPSTIF